MCNESRERPSLERATLGGRIRVKNTQTGANGKTGGTYHSPNSMGRCQHAGSIPAASTPYALAYAPAESNPPLLNKHARLATPLERAGYCIH